MSQSNPFLSSGDSASGSGPAGEARSVAAGQGWAWIVSGFELFKKAPGIWIVLMIILFAIVLVMAFIPLLGSIATALLLPVFTGGIMLGCQSLARGGTLEINHLFAGFKTQTGNLVVVGALALGASIVAMLPMIVIMGAGMFFGASRGDTAGMAAMGGTFMIAWLVTMALMVLVYMALWFAPALVVFRGSAPVAALKQSFAACLKNVVPFLIYGIVVMVAGIIAAIPLGLGLLVLLPVISASIFTAYQDIFGDA
ncbi:MAG TPA: BPSS1780 family membrane protein [Burkholderiales bacterium]|nr:BPSS1780 family membrane protein [Burkholderiales bacterium]